jgi:two-component system sensor histidine kinase KdpD
MAISVDPSATNWQTEARVMACVGYNPLSQRLIHTAARLAQAFQGRLYVVHIAREESTAPGYLAVLNQNLELARQLGATVLQEQGDNVPLCLAQVAKQHNITHIVMGESARSRLEEVMQGSLVRQILRASTGIDLYIVADQA